MAELAMHLIAVAAKDVVTNPAGAADEAAAAAPLPRPMMRDNQASAGSDKWLGLF